MVVGVIMGVSSNLLSLGGNAAIVVSERVAVSVTVKIDLRFFVADRNRVEIVDANRLEGHGIVAQCLLKLWGHEVVSRSRLAEDSEMHLEPEKVQEERNDNKARGASNKMLAKLWKAQGPLAAIDIREVPQINQDGDANGEEGEGTDVFSRDDAA